MTHPDASLLIADLMRDSGVAFGTSGARGPVTAMTDRVCHAYTLGFLQYLLASGQLPPGGGVALAGDYRPSSPRILGACARAVADLGLRPLHWGAIPTPALAHQAMARGIPSLMVTGSHIPDDRNGIKFNGPRGEILKEDEAAIRAQRVNSPPGLFDASGALRKTPTLPDPDPAPLAAYVARYLAFFPPGCLAGCRIGLYEHSSVAREALHAILTGLGAEVERLARADRFIPVDTEAIRPEDLALGRDWGASGRYDALVSADGDGDRPLVSDETGAWLRGDVAGLLTARHLGAGTVVTPVSSNTALERCGWFPRALRTRIGSPFVIAGMDQALAEGPAPVMGYEANGGFLLASDLTRDGRRLTALPTRDAVIVILGVLLLAREWGCPISRLAAGLPPRFTASDRLKDFPSALAEARLTRLRTLPGAIETQFGALFGAVQGLDQTDGLRIQFASGEIVHLRSSGNAPELRAYTEAASPERALEMNRQCLDLLARWREA